jgi:signal transduction histidine kinase
MKQPCDVEQVTTVWGGTMARKLAQNQAKNAQRATQHHLATALAVEDILSHSLRQGRNGEDEGITPPTIEENITAALQLIKQTFEAESAQCWWATPDATWVRLGAERYSAAQCKYLDRLVQAAIADSRPRVSVSRQWGTVAVFPMNQRDPISGALIIQRPGDQPLTMTEKTSGIFLAHRFCHEIGINQVWRNAHEHARDWHVVLNALPEMIIVRDKDQNVLFCNETAWAWAQNAQDIETARQQKQAIPPPRWDTYLPHQEPLPLCDVPSVRAISERTAVMAKQLELVTHPSNGTPQITPILVTAVPLNDSTGEPTRTVTIVQEITSTKRIEEMKDTFAKRVRHDINTYLTPTKIMAQFVLRRSQQALDAGEPCAALFTDLVRYAHRIELDCNQIEHVADSLATLDEVVNGTPSQISLVDYVREQLPDFRQRHPDYHFETDFDSANTTLVGYWCREHIDILFHNFMENAVKYSPLHSTITVKLFADVYDNVPTAHMVVIDQGIGMDRNDCDRVFDEHVRLDPHDAQGHAIPGSGEGLHYCKVIAMMYNMKPWAKSKGKGQGSEFHIRLPLAQ